MLGKEKVILDSLPPIPEIVEISDDGKELKDVTLVRLCMAEIVQTPSMFIVETVWSTCKFLLSFVDLTKHLK